MEQPLSIKHQEYEETEKRTPKAGYILLIIMFAASLFFGVRALDDLQEVPQRPEALSFCSSQFVEYNWEDYGRYRFDRYPQPEIAYEGVKIPPRENQECVFASFEVAHNVPVLFEKRKASDLKFRNLELELQQVSGNLFDAERQYNLGLQERIAEEQRRLYSIPEIQQNLEKFRKEKTALEIEIDALKAELKPLDEELKAAYRAVMRDYRAAYRWYEFKVFLLEAVFVFPFFFLVLWAYGRLLARRSPYTIIVTALVGVASVLVLKILFTWFWSLFLARVIETIWNFVQSAALLKSLIFYGGMFLSIAIFGGAVYFLQKRIFDPRRVAARRLRDKQCPSCQTSLDLAGEFCPSCGRKLKEKCQKCGNMRWTDVTFCPHCGIQK